MEASNEKSHDYDKSHYINGFYRNFEISLCRKSVITMNNLNKGAYGWGYTKVGILHPINSVF